jgi:hypothetical protein
MARPGRGWIRFASICCGLMIGAANPVRHYAVDASKGACCNLKKLADGPPSEAATNPDKVAWELFIQVNQPADSGKCPDLVEPSSSGTKSLGKEISSDTCWERWADAGPKGVYADPDHEPVWPANEARWRGLHPSVQNLQLQAQTAYPAPISTGSPSRGGVFKSEPEEEEEERMNRVAFDYIRCQGLWNKDGQVAALNEFNARRREEIQFPYGATEVKAGWRKLCDRDGPDCQVKNGYHWQLRPSPDGSGQEVWGLVALHVITKVLPTWLWATWEHKDNPELYKVRRYQHDGFGYPNGNTPSAPLDELFRKAGFGEASAWRNYRLIGTQINTVRATGEPTYLGNSVLERPVLSTSSCITCHSRAAVNANGVYLPIGRRPTPGVSRIESYYGSPDPLWFLDESSTVTTRYAWLPLDYVTSLRNAKWKKAHN